MDNITNFIQNNEYLIPSSYEEKSKTNIIIDNKSYILIRFIRKDKRNNLLLGEHFSLIINNDKLQGLYYLDKRFAALNMLSKEQSKDIAIKFLENFAYDLLSDYSIHWIERHDEEIKENGRFITISGMKVKMHNNKDGTWFWVVVSGDGHVIIFERDIIWINFPGHRKTEKWLHDSWYLEKINKKKIK